MSVVVEGSRREPRFAPAIVWRRLTYRTRFLRRLGWRNGVAYHWHSQRTRDRAFAVRAREAGAPLYCRPDTSDSQVLEQVFVWRHYACVDALPDIRRILDCGANVGYASAYLLAHHPHASVIAVEPDPGNVALLERNLQHYRDRARVLQAGIWSHRAGLRLDWSEGDAWGVQVRECSPGETAEVEAVDIGSLLDDAGWDTVDLVKMDIEGSENVVFGADCSHWLPRTRCLVVELHDERGRPLLRQAIAGRPHRMWDDGELTICVFD